MKKYLSLSISKLLYCYVDLDLDNVPPSENCAWASTINHVSTISNIMRENETQL